MPVIEKPFQHFPSNPSSMLVVVQEPGRNEQESEGDDLEDHFLPLTEQPKRVENLTYVGVGMILPSPKGIDLSLQPFKCDTRHRAGLTTKINSLGDSNGGRSVIKWSRAAGLGTCIACTLLRQPLHLTREQNSVLN